MYVVTEFAGLQFEWGSVNSAVGLALVGHTIGFRFTIEAVQRRYSMQGGPESRGRQCWSHSAYLSFLGSCWMYDTGAPVPQVRGEVCCGTLTVRCMWRCSLCMTHLLRAAQALIGVSKDPASWRIHNSPPPSPTARSSPMSDVAAQKAVRCLQLLKDMVVTCQVRIFKCFQICICI